MLRGLYTATAGMMTQQRKHDTVSNNIANMQTPGYKQNLAVSRSFPDMLIALMNGSNSSGSIGRMSTGVFAEENLTMYLQGELRETNNKADFALISNIQVDGLQFDPQGIALNEDGEKVYQPQAFITLIDGNGAERYTRNGQLNVNDAGELVTSSGERVLGADREPILLQQGLDQISVDGLGRLFDHNGLPVLNPQTDEQASILVSKINNPNNLILEGNGNYRLEDGVEAEAVDFNNPNDQVIVRQGYVEQSNVDPTQSMVDMMTAARIYEANQKMIQFYDRSLEKAVNEVGRV
jgi:flagellar basal-body rod protein FlgF